MNRIKELDDGRGKMFFRLRTSLKQAEAALDDRSGPFNSGLSGNTGRAVDFHEGEKMDSKELKDLIRGAVKLNASHWTRRPSR